LNPVETEINTASVKTLRKLWALQTPGSVSAQPVTVVNFNMPSGNGKNIAYFGDDTGYFYA
jgi:hypothetical protein